MEVRCGCGKMLGERSGSRLVIRRVGLILRGGTHTWDCPECGRRHTIDLDDEARGRAALDTLTAAAAH